jgi:hypothetical protein
MLATSSSAVVEQSSRYYKFKGLKSNYRCWHRGLGERK